MTINGAPSGADVTGASSSATQPAPAGAPSRSSLTAQLRASKAGNVKTEPASPVDEKQTSDALGAQEPGKNTEGDTPDLQGGKGEKRPEEKKETEGDPPWLKERLGRERKQREKVEADLHKAKGDVAKLLHLFEVAVAENERLLEERRTGVAFDEKGEEIQALKLQSTVEKRLAEMENEHRQALLNLQRESQVKEIASGLKAEVSAACAEFPLVSDAEVRAALRKNPDTDIRQFAQAKHEERKAYASKQSGAATKNLPSTVDKPTGVATFEPPLSRKGMADAFKHARNKR